MHLCSVGKFHVTFLPIGIVREISAEEKNNLLYLNVCAEVQFILEILTQTAAPRVIGEEAVVGIINNSVDSIALKEAGILTGYKVSNSVGIVIRHVVSVVRIE